MEKMTETQTAIKRALREASLAYQFCPGSYTYAILNELYGLKSLFVERPNWIEEYFVYESTMNERPPWE